MITKKNTSLIILIIMLFMMFYILHENTSMFTTNKNQIIDHNESEKQTLNERNNKTSVLRKTEENLKEIKKSEILRFAENVAKLKYVSNEQLLELDRLAERLAKSDPQLGIEVLRVLSASTNNSLKYNFCAKYSSCLRADGLFQYYSYMVNNPIVVRDNGDVYEFRQDICDRIFELSRDDIELLSNQFTNVSDDIISIAIRNRIQTLIKFESGN